MTPDSLSPRLAAAVGALALVPVVWYGIAASGTAGLFSAINVALILAALALAMSPTSGHGNASA